MHQTGVGGGAERAERSKPRPLQRLAGMCARLFVGRTLINRSESFPLRRQLLVDIR